MLINLKKLATIILLVWLLMPAAGAQTEPKPVNVYFFRGEGCPHCAREEVFLEQLSKERSNVSVRDFEIWYDRRNAQLVADIIKQLGLDLKASGVPLTFIGGQAISGYYTDETTGQQIKQVIDYYQTSGDPDPIGKIIAAEQATLKPAPDNIDDNNLNKTKLSTINLPLVGQINAQNFSLGALSA
ncbi:MAG: hypothetical protein AAB740_04690, partial [Patescibacteria group bacterium]